MASFKACYLRSKTKHFTPIRPSKRVILQPSCGFEKSGRTCEMKRSALILAAISAIADAATIYSVEPNRGSLAGGTYVTIWGTGFNRDGREGTTVA
jgi:hypothetical protein